MTRARKLKPRRYPITRRNSTVLGYDARGKTWDRWWRTARWKDAMPTLGGVDASACLVVPVPDWSDPSPLADRAMYRVRPKREGKRIAVKVRGRWYWEYH